MGHIYDARQDGCETCGHTGYLGRTGIFELLEVTKEISEKMLAGTSLVQLQQLLHSGGWPTMRHDGVAKMLAAQTSLAEVLRVTVETT